MTPGDTIGIGCVGSVHDRPVHHHGGSPVNHQPVGVVRRTGGEFHAVQGQTTQVAGIKSPVSPGDTGHPADGDRLIPHKGGASGEPDILTQGQRHQSLDLDTGLIDKELPRAQGLVVAKSQAAAGQGCASRKKIGHRQGEGSEP